MLLSVWGFYGLFAYEQVLRCFLGFSEWSFLIFIYNEQTKFFYAVK